MMHEQDPWNKGVAPYLNFPDNLLDSSIFRFVEESKTTPLRELVGSVVF